MTTATLVNAIWTPQRSSSRPMRPRRPKASSSATPATTGGIVIGRSTSVSSASRPLKRPRASR